MRSLFYLLIMLTIPLTSGAAKIPKDKEIIYFESSKRGTVTFLHKMHSQLDDVKCTTCHHTLEGNQSQEPEDCHKCHQSKKKSGEAPKSIEAFHTRCRGCHQYTVESGGKAGPVKKCKLCHVKPERNGENDATQSNR